ncbi:MAG TPA: hypothetical protein P5272_02840 [Caldisericia bacterium]|nr:hypothetical protein [Caldisericia bacterium]HOL82576.1 hypothetical protein [Caldisericia bacterium]HPC56257.1 hypothetical protein [Caldisericia bacterium]HRU73904.1 hypothetical protein [Caldisericia bacterium]
MKDLDIIKKIGRNFGTIKLEERNKYLNLEFIYDSFKNIDGVFLWEDKSDFYLIYFLSSEAIFKIYYENENKIVGDEGEKKFLSNNEGDIYFYKIDRKAIIPILSLYFGETLYKDLDAKVIDFSQFIESIAEKKLTGILTISNNLSDFIILYDGMIEDVKDGEIFLESPISIESDSMSIVSFAKLIMMENSSITLHTIDKDRKFEPVKLSFLKYDLEKIKGEIKEISKKILKDRIKKVDDIIDSINSKDDIYKSLEKIKSYVIPLYNKKIYSDIENEVKKLIEQ